MLHIALRDLNSNEILQKLIKMFKGYIGIDFKSLSYASGREEIIF